MDDSEIILEVMEGAPASWNTVLTTQLYVDVIEFQSAIRFHEDTLIRLDATTSNSNAYRRDRFEPAFRDNNPFREPRNQYTPCANLVGASKTMSPPSFPKDDSNLTKRSATPEEKGARPCRHCGSGKHWDNECKYAFRGNCSARANLATASEDTVQAQQQYDDLYYGLDSANEEQDFQIIDDSNQDFYKSLQNYGATEPTIATPLEGKLEPRVFQAEATPISGLNSTNQEHTAKAYRINSSQTVCAPFHSKPPLNRRSRRRLARDINARTYIVLEEDGRTAGKVVELKKFMARPPGCAFLGSKAMQATVTVGTPGVNPMSVIVDSGSDITLISQKTLENLICKPKIRVGQKINLIQVTGTSTISGFVTLDLFFHTKDGPVKINVEAYVVKFLHVANFSKSPVIISEGQVLGIGRNPNSWLDKKSGTTPQQESKYNTYANLIKSLADMHQPGLDHQEASNPETLTVISQMEISSKAQKNATEPDDPASGEPIEGGPKTSETPADSIPTSRLLEEVNISKDLTSDQRERLAQVIVKNAKAFGLDGRLGNYHERIEIPMKPGAIPISLPPFPVSPAKREVIDKQMDSWIKLGVIEPSKSPWAAPIFIVYRNKKPRMVIDLRRLNDQVIPDEFPIPKQEDILQALTGSQWLTTLDALAGFTQLTMSDSAAEKLAFRTHRGLWQFRRMPFGYRNGPSLFQQIMQNVLAPFLWIFALVYIDDIVIFSLSFDDHLKHLDQVFSTIANANITLSPAKCHFAYQSLLLLGQKVSRLGLSTHKEKVDAILALEVPRNVSELHTFLGMMVYFSAYIPFYSWIAHPLFQLLKKDTAWEWTDLHQEAFDLSKQVLTNAPVRGYAMEGLPYRLYTDACDYGLAGILQQVQPIAIRDLKGTRTYERLEKAFRNNEEVPTLVPVLSKDSNDVPKPGPWGGTFDDTIVHVER